MSEDIIDFYRQANAAKDSGEVSSVSEQPVTVLTSYNQNPADTKQSYYQSNHRSAYQERYYNQVSMVGRIDG